MLEVFENKEFVGSFVDRGGFWKSLDNLNLVSHIKDNLYVGGCVGGTDVADFFSHIFSLYMWERYVFDESKTEFHEFEMYDSRNGLSIEMVERVSDLVADALRDGGNVLIHCQAGITRSNLVASVALMKRYGMSAREAVSLLEDRRSSLVLSNQAFRDYALGLDRA